MVVDRLYKVENGIKRYYLKFNSRYIKNHVVEVEKEVYYDMKALEYGNGVITDKLSKVVNSVYELVYK